MTISFDMCPSVLWSCSNYQRLCLGDSA